MSSLMDELTDSERTHVTGWPFIDDDVKELLLINHDFATCIYCSDQYCDYSCKILNARYRYRRLIHELKCNGYRIEVDIPDFMRPTTQKLISETLSYEIIHYAEIESTFSCRIDNLMKYINEFRGFNNILNRYSNYFTRPLSFAELFVLRDLIAAANLQFENKTIKKIFISAKTRKIFDAQDADNIHAFISIRDEFVNIVRTGKIFSRLNEKIKVSFRSYVELTYPGTPIYDVPGVRADITFDARF